MAISISHTSVRSILTRTSGYLQGVATHSLQPYRGCTFGNSLCGVGCYVKHNGHILRGRDWGGFLEVRDNAAEIYGSTVRREAAWARRTTGQFIVFCSSSTDPFLPHERKFGVTRQLLTRMCEAPPDGVILQTHSHEVAAHVPLLTRLHQACSLRIHISIESDRETLPGLPPPASSVSKRLEACSKLRDAGLQVIVTVAPLLPILNPDKFFGQIAESADGVVLDHFIGGDGSPEGSRTRRTSLPGAIEQLDPRALTLDYLDDMIRVAQSYLPGRVGTGPDGFAGRWLAQPS